MNIRQIFPRALLGAMAVGAAACSDGGGASDKPGANQQQGNLDTGMEQIGGADDSATDPSDPCGTIPADDAAFAQLFDTSRVHAIALTLDDAATAQLAADPGDYVVADVTVDGVVLPGVGARLRGDALDTRWDGKPGFKVDLRAFAACTTIAGMRRLTLDAMTTDPAQGRVVAAHAILAAAGYPVSAATWARVSVNGEDYGLYALLETVDGSFVRRHFTDPDGVLWEGDAGADFTGAGVEEWHDVDSDGDDADLQAVAEVVAGAGDDFYAQADALVDMDQFVSVWGGLAAVGEPGAYPYETDNVYLYQPPSGTMRFVPWDLQTAWDDSFDWVAVKGALAIRCVYDATCTTKLNAGVSAALGAVDAVDPAGIAQAVFAASSADVANDPRRTAPAADVQSARDALVGTIGGWTDRVRGAL